MRRDITTYMESIVHDNAEFIKYYNSVADYIIINAEQTDNWYEFFDYDEYDIEPSEEQIDELKCYLYKYYN